ncbi:hypothetical protein L0244_12655 [bacterium]|nr:hypothetical protein [bacterium]
MKPPNEYKRLPGTGHAFLGFGRSSLWLGEDHIMLIQRRGYVEEYKRFYFRDICTIVIQKTGLYLALNAITIALLSGFLFLHFLGIIRWHWDRSEHIALAIPSASLLLILLVNTVKGPTCLTKLGTAVHAVNIPSMNRLRSSLRIVARLRKKIEETQGHLSREVLLQHPKIEEPPVLFPPPLRATGKSSLINDSGTIHLSLFVFLLIDAIATIISIFDRSQILLVFSLISSFVFWFLLIMALIRQRRRTVPSGVSGLTWGVLIYSVIYYTWSYLFTMFFAIQHPAATSSRWEWIKTIWALSPLENPGLFVMSVFSIACSLSLGIPGLISVLRFRALSKAKNKIQIAGGEAA